MEAVSQPFVLTELETELFIYLIHWTKLGPNPKCSRHLNTNVRAEDKPELLYNLDTG